MTAERTEAGLDQTWLNDRSEFQLNFVHGLNNPWGLHIEYRLEGHRVVADWTPSAAHLGFPGFVHGGLIAALLDDVMGRCSVLHRRWVVTGRMETRYRAAARIGDTLRAQAWITRLSGRSMHAQGQVLSSRGAIVADATGTYLPAPQPLLEQMVAAWPGFREFLDGGA